jgi:RNA polymerase sigma factor (sigma-70 family)
MDYSKLTDKQLIEIIVNNDSKAAAFLFHEKCHKLFTYIQYSLFQNKQVDVNELINELYVYLEMNNWEKLREFQYRSQLTTWMSTVAIRYFRRNFRNLVIDYTSKEPLIDDKFNIKDSSAENFVTKIDVLDAIQKMKNPMHRLILFKLEIEGCQPEELAEKHATTVSNIYNIKSRAKKELQTLLSEVEDYER